MKAKDYRRFEAMRDSGCGPTEVTSAAIAEGFNFVDNLHMLRAVFNLELVHAKEAWIQANGFASSLDEYQECLIPEIERALAELDEPNR